jgi:hypothetical protein
MTMKIHYTIGGYEDCYTLSADTIEEILEKNKVEMEKRGLDAVKNDCWSEEII